LQWNSHNVGQQTVNGGNLGTVQGNYNRKFLPISHRQEPKPGPCSEFTYNIGPNIQLPFEREVDSEYLWIPSPSRIGIEREMDSASQDYFRLVIRKQWVRLNYNRKFLLIAHRQEPKPGPCSEFTYNIGPNIQLAFERDVDSEYLWIPSPSRIGIEREMDSASQDYF
jgi:hypothetical protein